MYKLRCKIHYVMYIFSNLFRFYLRIVVIFTENLFFKDWLIYILTQTSSSLTCFSCKQLFFFSTAVSLKPSVVDYASASY